MKLQKKKLLIMKPILKLTFRIIDDVVTQCVNRHSELYAAHEDISSFL